MNKQYFKDLGQVIIGSGKAFMDDKAMKYSGSLAYSTVFALSPLLVLIISLASIFFKEDAINNKVFGELQGLMGADTAMQLQELIKKSALSGGSGWSLAISIVILLIGASAIFTEIQDTINIIWRVKPKPKTSGIKRLIVNRLLSFSMVIGLGFLLVASLLINGIIAAISDQLNNYFPGITIFVVNAVNMGVTFVVITMLFAVIFKYLPDVKIKWKDVLVGAFTTAILFMIARYGIQLYLKFAGTASTFGAAGSVVVILVWVYFTAAILYFGAEFTQVYTEKFGGEICPADYAVHLAREEKEVEVDVLPSKGYCSGDKDDGEDCEVPPQEESKPL